MSAPARDDQAYTAIDTSIFDTVQEQIERDTQIREAVRESLKTLDKQVKLLSSLLSRVHSVPPSQVSQLVVKAAPALDQAREDLGELIKVVEPYPYYKFNHLWTRDLQNLVFMVLLSAWLERVYVEDEGVEAKNALLTIEETGEVLGVPVNLKTEDRFHLTVEEYLHAVISLVEELSRLITNAAIQRDFRRPPLIATFVKDIHSAFQVLNLKNDSLRRRGDGLKYNVKRVEDINYDLTVRNLIPSVAVGEGSREQERTKEEVERGGMEE